MKHHASRTVLVLDADMVSALAVARALHRHGLQVDVASAMEHPIAGYSKCVRSSFRYPDPLVSEDAFADWLDKHIAGTPYDLVIPVTERTVIPLSARRERFEGTVLALASEQALAVALDKAKTLSLAHKLGIPAPHSVEISEAGQIEACTAGLEYPIVIKPSRSFGMHNRQRTQLSVDYAFDADELRVKAAHALRFGKVLLQEYVGGEGVGIELIADHGRIVYAFQHLRLHEVPLTGGGSSLRISVEADPGLLDAASKLMAALSWHGVAMVEFKRHPASGAISLMEINGRFWGSLPLAIAAGADFPVMLYELLIKGGVGSHVPARTGVIGRNLSRDVYWAELVMRRDGPARLVRFPGRGEVLSDALLMFSPRHHFDVQAWRDPWPGVVDFWRVVRTYVLRIQGVLAERRLAKRLAKPWQNGRVARTLKAARNVLFICYGNINRSILAERYFQSRTRGMPVACSSAGFHDEIGRPADPVMIETAQQRGINLTSASSQRVNNKLVGAADVIFVMELGHYQRIVADFPEVAGFTFLLDRNGEIADPYGKSPEAYARCAGEIIASVDCIVDFLTHPEKK